jgi:glycosyltransferase involved in cell wall biosynthesis
LRIQISTDVTRVSADARRQLEGVEWLHTPLPDKFRAHLWEQWRLPREQPDAVQIYPLNTGPFLLPRRRQLLFVHDINFLLAPAVYSWSYRVWNRFASALAAQRSRNIICFTEHVKMELIKHLHIAGERISVVPQGPGIDLAAPAMEAREAPERFFLCVGGLQPHKNLKTTLEAFAKSGLPEKGYKLVIIGRAQSNFARLDIAEALTNASWLQFTGYVSDGELIDYYRRATGLVYISLMEGFGLPIVEGFHLDCPVITSNVSCLPEVAGTAALLVDPRDADAVAGAMQKLAGDSALRADLIGRGRERAKLYTWRRAAELVAAEVHRVARNA